MAIGNKSITFALVLQYQQFVQDSKKVQKAWKQAGANMTSIGRDLSVAVSAPLALLAREAYQVGEEFDLARQKLKAFSTSSGGDISELEAQARQLGATTIFTATEVIGLQLSLRRLGQEDATIKQITGTVLKFSQALDVDLASSGEFVVQTMNRMTDTFKGFTDPSTAAAYAAEGFAYAVANSALTVDGLRASLNYVGAEANAAGLSFSETTAILAQLANSGYTGSRAGTQLRRVFTELTKDGVDVSKQFFEIVKSGYSFEEALSIVGVRAAGVFSALGGASADIKAFEEAIRGSEDVLTDFSDYMDDSIFASTKKVESAFGELAITITDLFAPALKFINEFLANLFQGFSRMPGIVQVVTVALLGIIAILPPLTFLFGALTKAVSSASIAIGGFAVSLNAILGVAAGVVFVLALIASRMGGIKKPSEQAKAEIEAVKDSINELARAGDREAAVRRAIEEQEAAIVRKRANEEQLEIDKERLSVLRGQLDNLDKIAFTRRLSATGVPLAPELKDDYRETYNNAVSLYKAQQDIVSALEDKIAVDREVITITGNVIENNADLADSIYNQTSAYENSTYTINGLIRTYQDLNNQVINIQQTFASSTGGTEAQEEEMNKLIERIDELRKRLKAFGVDVEKLDEVSSDNVISVAALTREYGLLTEQLKELTSEDTINLTAVDELTTRLSELEAIFKLIGLDMAEIVGSEEWAKAQEDALDESEKKTKSFREALRSLRDQFLNLDADPLTAQLRELKNEVQQTITDLELNTEQAKALADAFQLVADKMIKLQEEQEELVYQQKLAEWMNSIIQLSTSFVNGIFDIISGTKTMGQVLIDVFKRVTAKLIGLIIAYGILVALSGRVGAAAAAIESAGTLGNFLTSNLLGGLAAPTRSAEGLRVAGVVSGSNLVISTERGITAYDRTYG